MALLVGGGRRNAENLSEVVPHVSAHALQRLLTNAHWDWEPVIAKLQAFYGERLGSAEGIFTLDDTGFGKQGSWSVGVARQYSGTLGKVGNCQIGVFLAYVSPRGFALVDGRIYLPAEWTTDATRCARAHIPEEARVYQSKTDLEFAMLREARRRGVLPGRWVTADEEYGKVPSFRDALHADGWLYVLEMPCITTMFTAPAQTAIPPWSGQGRHPTKLQLVAGAPRPRAVRDIVARGADSRLAAVHRRRRRPRPSPV